jgi:hypothetical protein
MYVGLKKRMEISQTFVSGLQIASSSDKYVLHPFPFSGSNTQRRSEAAYRDRSRIGQEARHLAAGYATIATSLL